MGSIDVQLSSLQELESAFNSCASSLASLRGSINNYINQTIGQAQDIVAQYCQQEVEAARIFKAADAAYTACLSRRTWDDEDKCYRLSCNCEKRDKNRAEDAYRKASDLRKTAEQLLEDMKYEVSHFNSSPAGSGHIIDSLVDSETPKATERLQKFIELVSRHTSMSVGISYNGTNESRGGGANKVDTFQRGAEQLQNRIKARKFCDGQSKLLIRESYCNKCKCAPCKCDKTNQLIQMINSRSR